MTTKVISNRATEAKQTITKVIKNVTEFIQAASLVVVDGYAIWAVKTNQVDGWFAWVLAGAAAVIALMAAVLLVRHFNR